MIVPDGPAAYFSTLPIKRIVMRLMAAGIPAQVSNSAGTFVCNHVFYGLMDFMKKEGKGAAAALSMCRTFRSRPPA